MAAFSDMGSPPASPPTTHTPNLEKEITNPTPVLNQELTCHASTPLDSLHAGKKGPYHMPQDSLAYEKIERDVGVQELVKDSNHVTKDLTSESGEPQLQFAYWYTNGIPKH